jgi:hypothetical protein
MSPLDTQFAFPRVPDGLSFSLADQPILIDGMKVLFDQKVALFPVTVKPEQKQPDAAG